MENCRANVEHMMPLSETIILCSEIVHYEIKGLAIAPSVRETTTKESYRMPKRSDIKKILIIGSGPIIIGQACEFDYSGTQACKALREAGYEIVLVNSNPARLQACLFPVGSSHP